MSINSRKRRTNGKERHWVKVAVIKCGSYMLPQLRRFALQRASFCLRQILAQPLKHVVGSCWVDEDIPSSYIIYRARTPIMQRFLIALISPLPHVLLVKRLSRWVELKRLRGTKLSAMCEIMGASLTRSSFRSHQITTYDSEIFTTSKHSVSLLPSSTLK